MIKFKKRLEELMQECELTVEDLQHKLNLEYNSIIYFWLDGTYLPKLNYLNQLANIFECSLDYLIGTSNNNEENKKPYPQLPAFDVRLSEILKNKKITKYKIRKDKVATSGLFRSIFKDKSDPTIETLIKLSDYLNITIDNLVGRE